MRRVNVMNGIQERLQDILGTGPGNTPSDGWSIQSAMIDNVRRVVRGLVGDSPNGRVLKGLVLSTYTQNKFGVSPGIAFTENGNVITVAASLSKAVTGTGKKYIYLNHTMSILPQNSPLIGGKSTTLVNKQGRVELVSDDSATTKAGSVQEISDTLLTVFDTSQSEVNPDAVFLGTVTVTDGVIVLVEQTYTRGFAPTSGEPRQVLWGVISQESSKFYKSTEFYDDVTFGVDGLSVFNSVVHFGANSTVYVYESGIPKKSYTGNVVYIDNTGGTETTKTLKFINGILVE